MYWLIGSSFASRTATIFAVSRTLPPPSATTASAPLARNASRPATTLVSVGSGWTSLNSVTPTRSASSCARDLLGEALAGDELVGDQQHVADAEPLACSPTAPLAPAPTTIVPGSWTETSELIAAAP